MTGAPAALGDLALRTPRLTQGLAAAHATLYRRTEGRMLARWFGASILVMETIGRRTGRTRRTPLVYVRDGADLVVVPANGGADRTPAWWLNLRDADRGVALLGRERRPVRPVEARGAERERLWRRVAAVSPLDHYQRRTDRRIPVVVLVGEPIRPAPAAAWRTAA